MTRKASLTKTGPGSTAVSRRFVYDEAGHRIGEYDNAGAHADQINTPRAIPDTQGTIRWRWDSDPFVVNPPDQDPDGDTVAFTYNLRYPGQYFDAEARGGE